ncbi:ATP-binding protein [Fibrobacterota bacterium]
MINRILKKQIIKRFFSGKALIIQGPRQSGKTTLAQDILNDMGSSKEVRIFNCDNPTDRELLENRDINFLKQLVGKANLVFIDEGQKVVSLGQTLKLLVDHYKKNIQIIVTGSSSIEMSNLIQEALTGRKHTYTLLPFSIEERHSDQNMVEISKDLETLLLFGMYPEVTLQPSFEEKIELLSELHSSYLYKDVLQYQNIKRPELIQKLTKALALQIGSEVSLSELSNLLGIDKKTVERYVDLLEKSFVVFRLPPFSRNKRREISKTKKIFFYDLGIRNAIINNFNLLESRNDSGALWENFVIVERMKYRINHRVYSDQYFWRTFDGSEVDLIEERDGRLFGYELKWNIRRKSRRPVKWLEYPGSSHQIITPKDLPGFLF